MAPDRCPSVAIEVENLSGGRRMLKGYPTRGRKLFMAVAVAAALIVSTDVWAGSGVCTLEPNPNDPSEKTLQCDDVTVTPAQGTSYRPLYKRHQHSPSAIRLDDGALLIEFHPSARQNKFQILTPLAIAAVRGTKWAMEVSSTRTSTLVLSGTVAVTSRRLNQYVTLTEGQGVDITEGDTSLTVKQWGQARIRALLSRFGE
jgi:ferric-dicitrate binding protein FerR (iron transport regulator)